MRRGGTGRGMVGWSGGGVVLLAVTHHLHLVCTDVAHDGASHHFGNCKLRPLSCLGIASLPSIAASAAAATSIATATLPTTSIATTTTTTTTSTATTLVAPTIRPAERTDASAGRSTCRDGAVRAAV